MNPVPETANRFERWQNALLDACGDYETRMARQGGLFIGEISARRHAGLSMACIRTNAGRISKRYRPDRNDDRQCFLVAQRSGYTRVEQGGQTVNLAPGDVFIMDSASDCDMQPMGLIEHVSISLPRDQVAHSLKNKRVLFGKVSSGCFSGTTLRLILNQFYHQERATGDSPRETEAMVSAFCSLLGSSLLGSETDDCSSVMGSNLLDQVRGIIDGCLAHTSLTPVMIAQRAGISVRHLYRLFEEQGDSVCRYIQRSRLQRSADDLANLTGRDESITAIAYKWGFTDSAHFSRSFKKQFQLSPREYRKKVLS